MPIVDYPFQAQGKFSEPSPILPLRIINPKNSFEYLTWGLVDTGATSSTIPDYIAIALGHDPTKGKLCPGFTGSGPTNVYEHTCRIEILEMDSAGRVKDNVILTIPDKGKYIGVLEGCPFVLLGVKDFLKKYVLTVDYSQQVFSIRKPQPNKRKNNK